MDRLGRSMLGLEIRLACLFGALDTDIRYECNDLPSSSRVHDVLLIGPRTEEYRSSVRLLRVTV